MSQAREINCAFSRRRGRQSSASESSASIDLAWNKHRKSGKNLLMDAAKYTTKENESDARERLRAFWEGSSLGRPALLVKVRRRDDSDSPWQTDPRDSKTRDWSIDFHVQVAEWQLSSSHFLAEAMPHAMLVMGSLLTTLSGLAGADYEYRTGSAWIRPIPNLWEQPLPQFDPAEKTAEFIGRALHAIADVVGHRGFVNTTAYLDPLTALAEMRGQDLLLADLLEEPEMVRRWCNALTDLYIQSYDHFFRLLSRRGYGESCTWLGAMAEGKMEAVQCDVAVNIAPALFERFVLPDLRRITDYLDYSLYHLDGTCQLRFLDLLRSCPNLTGIQWNPEPSANPPTRWLDAFREIRRRGFSLYVGCSVEEAVEITRALGPDGLLFSLPLFETAAEAEAAIARIQKAC